MAADRPPQPSARPPAVPRWQRKGSDASDDRLQRFTLAWIKTLPEAVRPQQCARRYPRVLNAVAALWNQPGRCAAYLQELHADRRGDRLGFGHGVADELRRLHAYRLSLLPAASRDEGPGDFNPTEPMAP